MAVPLSGPLRGVGSSSRLLDPLPEVPSDAPEPSSPAAPDPLPLEPLPLDPPPELLPLEPLPEPLLLAGSPVVTEFLTQRLPVLADIARGLSISDRFTGFTRGVVGARDLVYFASFIGFFLFVNAVVLDHRKAD